MLEKIIILDSGSQFTQLIGRRLRDLQVYCEIYPYNKEFELDESIKGIILSGSPFSVRDNKAPQINIEKFKGKVPIMAICYGAQYIANKFGGDVNASLAKEYGRAMLSIADHSTPLFKGIYSPTCVWMSHGDTIAKLPEGAKVIASTDDIENAAYCIEEENIFCVQFHPEASHTEQGLKMFENFAISICGCKGDWTSESFIDSSIKDLRSKLGEDRVILGLSGGVDSSVAAVLLNRAIGSNLFCIFVNNGLLRKNEFTQVLASYKDMGLNVVGVDASDDFLNALKGVVDPEQKRKAIGKVFIDVFDREAGKVENAKWLAQGTIYPDVIESVSVNGPSATIKTHHNVGGLPDKMNLKVVEPLRTLFKDEVRRVGRALGIKEDLISRHPFPGPGLGIRVLGEVSRERLEILRDADDIFINALRTTFVDATSQTTASGMQIEKDKISLYDSVWQAAAILLPIKSVGVMGDERTYEYTIALRSVISTDGMSADWVRLPYDFLAKISNDIINKVKGVNRVVYDISSKPPATIEWE